MLKAKQAAVLQNTNQLLIQIRQFEIDYYSNLFQTFGMLGKLFYYIILYFFTYCIPVLIIYYTVL